jgi:hypothetical protein
MTQVEGGFKTLPAGQVDIYEIHNYNGFSGYNYWIAGKMVGQLHLSSLSNGWFCLFKYIYFENELIQTYTYYNAQGDFSHESAQFDGGYENYHGIQMDPTSPLLNHMYNILQTDYEATLEANGNSKRIQLFETILNMLLKDPELNISARKYRSDSAYHLIKKDILETENDKVLRWTERQKIYNTLLEKRQKIIDTKKRAHSFMSLTYSFPFILSNILLKLQLIKKRPTNNLKGLFYKYTLGQIIWFVKTVKDNLGYSIALAIYGPFTYYFITQPMNPHAMSLVGEVREAYISISNQVSDLFETSDEVIPTNEQKSDSVSTKLAAIKKTDLTKQNAAWKERMSNFKAMHIAHESNLLFAERMGRLEQIETQLNFPLAVEAAWNEVQRYERAVTVTLKYTANLKNDYRHFLNKELIRAKDARVYLWERMAQFFIDYPYILVDQDMEQTQKNVYTGRAFVFMQKMTDTLSKDKTLSIPATHKKIKQLADFYKKSKINAETTIERLEKNSALFASRDLYNSDKFRSYMKRHWEILFLQQNKKQEAASFGMQAYSASIKNAIWTIQALYSAKRDDHMVLSYKFNLDNQNTENSIPYQETSEEIEHLLHFIAFDYASIKKEFANNIKNDKEAMLRERLIGNIKEYVAQRDMLLQSTRTVQKQTQLTKTDTK